MALIDKLTNIADAIRGKTGGTDPLTLDAMAEAITAIETGGGGSDGGALLDAIINRSITELETNITVVGQYAFRGCTSLKSVIALNAVELGSNAFAMCSSLETVSFPSLTKCNGYDFSGCVKLIDVFMPNLTGVGSCTFQNCSKLERAYLPAVTYFNANAFQGCVALEEIDFLGGSTIGVNAYNGSTKLSRLIIRSNTKLSNLQNVSAFNNTPFASNGTGGTVYVPQALIAEYQQATNWSTLYAAGTCNFVAIEGSEYE